MSATAKIKLQFGTISQTPGSPQTASILVALLDNTGAMVAYQSVSAPGGVPSANEVDLAHAAGTGFTASAQALDTNGAAVGSKVTSAAFDLVDNIMVTVPIGVTGSQ